MTKIDHNGGPLIDGDRGAIAERLYRDVRYCLCIRRYVAWNPAQWYVWNERLERAQAELDRVIGRNPSSAKPDPRFIGLRPISPLRVSLSAERQRRATPRLEGNQTAKEL